MHHLINFNPLHFSLKPIFDLHADQESNS